MRWSTNNVKGQGKNIVVLMKLLRVVAKRYCMHWGICFYSLDLAYIIQLLPPAFTNTSSNSTAITRLACTQCEITSCMGASDMYRIFLHRLLPLQYTIYIVISLTILIITNEV